MTGGIYIHIPFCKHRCIYCDFFSTTLLGKEDLYVNAVIQELALRREYIEAREGLDIATIYLGGGTPSLLKPSSIQMILETIDRLYHIQTDAEITIETNPEDTTPEKIKALTALPINRVSMGVQTFNDNLLKTLGRRHDSARVMEAVRELHKHNLYNISIDLIYGLPHQNISQWKDDVTCALDVEPHHISAYALIYEPHTRLWQMKQRHEVQETEEETSLDMYNYLIDTLQHHGFKHYEISSFALPGCESRHNASYWRMQPYLGVGAGAHSFNGINRTANVNNVTQYISLVNEAATQGLTSTHWCETEWLTPTDRYNDLITTALRTSDGIDLNYVKETFGTDTLQYCLQAARPHLDAHLLEVINPTESPLKKERLRLTRQGIFVSDDIMSDLIKID